MEEDPKAADPKAKDAKKDAKGEEDAEVRKTGTTDTVAQVLIHINEYPPREHGLLSGKCPFMRIFNLLWILGTHSEAAE